MQDNYLLRSLVARGERELEWSWTLFFVLILFGVELGFVTKFFYFCVSVTRLGTIPPTFLVYDSLYKVCDSINNNWYSPLPTAWTV